MLRRLADRVSNAVAQATMSTEQQHIQTLCSMGYPEADARAAYSACGGDVDRAAEQLLSSSNGINTHHHPTEALQQQEDDDLQRALQASMIQPQTGPSAGNNTTKNNTSIRSAASRKAGQAALSRFDQKQQPKKKNTSATKTASRPTLNDSNVSNTASKKRSTSPVPSHPGVKVPAKLSDKSKEERIVRTADRVKSYPQAVDTLYKALKGLQMNPTDPKFQQIDQSSVGYQKSLASVPGAEDLLLAMNYQKVGNKLNLGSYCPATVYLGISALEQIKEVSIEYKHGKARLQLERDIRSIQESANSSSEEAIGRANFMSKCPSEPSPGRGSWMYIQLTSDNTIQRRFDGDDTLQDVLHWLGGHGTEIFTKLVETKEWGLVDLHRSPPMPFKDLETLQHKTLQYIGCWPSGKLAIQPMSVIDNTANPRLTNNSTSKDGSAIINDARSGGSSRGLGAAPSESLET